MKKWVYITSIVFFTMSCNGQNTDSSQTVHEKLDKQGRVIERYGNYHTSDRNTNFRYFFFYDSVNRVVFEKRYFFEDNNQECQIIDTLDCDKIYYKYDTTGKLILEEIYNPKYSPSGTPTGHFLAYRKDYLNNKEETFKEQ